jgi:hypothetical protein
MVNESPNPKKLNAASKYDITTDTWELGATPTFARETLNSYLSPGDTGTI